MAALPSVERTANFIFFCALAIAFICSVQGTRPRLAVNVIEMGSFVKTYVNDTNYTEADTEMHDDLEVDLDVDADTDQDGEADDFTDLVIKEQTDDKTVDITQNITIDPNSTDPLAAALASGNLPAAVASLKPTPPSVGMPALTLPADPMNGRSGAVADLMKKAQDFPLSSTSSAANGAAVADLVKQATNVAKAPAVKDLTKALRSADAGALGDQTAALGDLAKQAMTDVMSMVNNGPLGKLSASTVDPVNGKGSLGDMIEEALQSKLADVSSATNGAMQNALGQAAGLAAHNRGSGEGPAKIDKMIDDALQKVNAPDNMAEDTVDVVDYEAEQSMEEKLDITIETDDDKVDETVPDKELTQLMPLPGGAAVLLDPHDSTPGKAEPSRSVPSIPSKPSDDVLAISSPSSPVPAPAPALAPADAEQVPRNDAILLNAESPNDDGVTVEEEKVTQLDSENDANAALASGQPKLEELALA